MAEWFSDVLLSKSCLIDIPQGQHLYRLVVRCKQFWFPRNHQNLRGSQFEAGSIRRTGSTSFISGLGTLYIVPSLDVCNIDLDRSFWVTPKKVLLVTTMKAAFAHTCKCCVCCVGHDSFRGFISIINKTTRHIVFRENTTADRWSKSGEVGGRCKDLIPSNFMLKCRHDDHQTTAKHTSLPSITNGYCSIYLQLPPWWLALVAVNMVQPILAVSHHSIRDSLSYCSIHDVDEATRFSSFIRNSLRNSIDTRQNSSPCTEGINLINTINFSSVILGCQLPHIALQFENHQNWQQGAIP